MEPLFKWLRHYVSPVFMLLLVASFVFWYIAKLNYTYTTEQVMRVNIGGERIPVTCVVEGVGTNLFGYRVYMDRTLRIPLSELHVTPSYEEESYGRLVIDPASLQQAISVRCSDIKIISISGVLPTIEKPEDR